MIRSASVTCACENARARVDVVRSGGSSGLPSRADRPRRRLGLIRCRSAIEFARSHSGGGVSRAYLSVVLPRAVGQRLRRLLRLPHIRRVDVILEVELEVVHANGEIARREI